MSVFVWTMAGLAIWHFTIFVPDRFVGGIAGAFLTAWLGALASGFAFEGLRLPEDNPPGVIHVLYAVPGAVLSLVASWRIGSRKHSER